MPEKGERSIGQLVTELTQELRTLFRQEIELFSVEMKEKMASAVKDAAAIGVGGVIIVTGYLVLIAAMVLGLATVMPAWGAALVVAAVFIATGAVLVLKGSKDLKQVELKPEKTTETLKETAKWVKTLRLPRSSRRQTGFASRSGIRKAI